MGTKSGYRPAPFHKLAAWKLLRADGDERDLSDGMFLFKVSGGFELEI
jgi:hypothetical protein